MVDLAIEDAPDRAARTHAVAKQIAARLSGADVVTGAGTLVVVGTIPGEELDAALAEALAQAGRLASPGKLHTIAACYDGSDLGPAAESLGVSADALVAMHSGRDYVVELLGFLPGFAYLGEVDPRIRLARRPSPRPSVAAGSIGIAGSFTAIYPLASPGGWNLIARALSVAPFDPQRDPPALFSPGDRVRFEPAEDSGANDTVSPERSGVQSLAEPPPRALQILTAPACATVQDAGRAGQLGRGLPPSGPLDPVAFSAANQAAGNPPGTAAIEVPLGALEILARAAIGISADGEPLQRIAPGERFCLPSATRAVRYLAVQGGIDVPQVLGARATLLVARLGGFRGRALRRGDILPVGDDRECGAPDAMPLPDPPAGVAEIEIDPGPHLDRFPDGALDALLAAPFCVSRLGDRVGVRLEGSRIPRDRPDFALPVPMIRGAVQVTTDGTPIVLGPDHPTTGGYPVIAVVRRASQGDLARRRPGHEVRFRLGR
jgi:KipI family sensor histidine kinase inhibitor